MYVLKGMSKFHSYGHVRTPLILSTSKKIRESTEKTRSIYSGLLEKMYFKTTVFIGYTYLEKAPIDPTTDKCYHSDIILQHNTSQ